MIPIEREDYVNAYIGAMTEEIRQTRIRKSVGPETTGTVDRLYRSVADKLTRWHHGPRSTTLLLADPSVPSRTGPLPPHTNRATSHPT
jgi:hypothetical protein